MIVVKLGGSLSRSVALINCLNSVAQRYQGRAVVIVPGGGAFADQVRLAQQHWQFDGRTAHRMAILAMQQMAMLFNGIRPDFAVASSVADIRRQLQRQACVIWSPDNAELEQAAIPASWDITSDSLAVWLAKTLGATELILVKSAVIDASLSLAQLAEKHIVDPGFCDAVRAATFKIQVVNQKSFGSL